MNNREVIEGRDPSMGDGTGISWINILLGIWVLISPFVLGFAQAPRAMWNNVIFAS